PNHIISTMSCSPNTSSKPPPFSIRVFPNQTLQPKGQALYKNPIPNDAGYQYTHNPSFNPTQSAGTSHHLPFPRRSNHSHPPPRHLHIYSCSNNHPLAELNHQGTQKIPNPKILFQFPTD